MKNERGLTLVELLAGLVILSVIMTILGAVLINGMKASNRIITNQQLQQEANYIVEMVRNKYLELDNSKKIEFEIDNDKKILKIDERILSEGYSYCFKGDCNGKKIYIDRTIDFKFELELKKGNTQSYIINTTFSKLR